MAIQYYMRAFKTSVPTGYVDWVVNDAPDTTGAFSGFPTNELTNIIVNRVVTSKVDNFLKPNHSLRGADGYYLHVNSYDWLRALSPVGVPVNLKTGLAAERGTTSIATVSGATNATPIVLTTTAHGLTIGQTYLVTVTGVLGNIAANGTFNATILNSTSMTLLDSEGSGTYTSGGTLFRPNDFSTLTWDEVTNQWRFVLNTNGDGTTLGASQNLRVLNSFVDGYASIGVTNHGSGAPIVQAQSGVIRLPNNQFVFARKAVIAGDTQIIGLDNLDNIKIGSAPSDPVFITGWLRVGTNAPTNADGYIRDGSANPSGTGFVRSGNNTTGGIVTFKHSGGSLDVTALSGNTSNHVVIGDINNVNTGIQYNTATFGGANTGVHRFNVGNTSTVPNTLVEIGSVSSPSYNAPFIRFPAFADLGSAQQLLSPSIYQSPNPTNSSVGQGLTIQAQNATGTTSTGGVLNLTSGTGTPNDNNAGTVNVRTGGVDKLTISPTVTTSNNANVAFGTSGTRTGLATTTIAAGSNGAVLPQATINVANTLGSSVLPAFPASGVINIVTSAGLQTVYYTGTTGTTLTGCTGGTGTMSTGGAVTSAPFITHNAVSAPSAKAQTLTIQSQNNTGATSVGGDLQLSAGTGTTQAGNVLIQTGGTTQIITSPVFISPGTTTPTTGSVVIRANLEVVGATTTIDSTIVDIIGRVIHANWSDPTVSPNVAVPSLMAGYSIHRGNSSGFARDGAAWIWTEGAQNNGSDGYWRANTIPGDGYGSDNFTAANSTNNVGVQANNFSPTPDPNPVAGTLPSAGSVRVPNNLPHLVARNVSPTTTIAAASNLTTLPQATLNVASTTGFTSAGTLLVFSDAGVQTVTYTGTTGTTFTGAVGGTGLLHTGQYIAQTNRATTIAAGSNNVPLPTGTINVASTVGFPASGTIRVVTSISAVTGQTLSVQTVAYTGTTATTFTGCTGGTGTMFTGNSVSSLPIPGTADLVLASTDFGNRVVWGSPTALTGHIFNTPTNTLFDFQVNSVPQIRIQANDTNSDGYVEVLEIEPTIVNPRVAQLVRPDTGANAGFQLMLQAQNGQQQTGGNPNNNGGHIVIASGAAGTGGTAPAVHGNVILQTDGILKMTIFPTFAASAADSNTMLIEENIIRIGPTQNVPRIRQDDTTNANGQSFSLQAQNAATRGGPLLLQSGTGPGSLDGYVNLVTGNTVKATFFPTFAISAADHNSILLFENKVRFDIAQTVPLIRQDDQTVASTNGQSLTLQAQNATGVTSNGGPLLLKSGTGTGSDGYVEITTGSVVKARFNPTFAISPADSNTLQLFENIVRFDSTMNVPRIRQDDTVSASGQSLSLQAQNAATTGGPLLLQSGTGATNDGYINLITGTTTKVTIFPTTATSAGDNNSILVFENKFRFDTAQVTPLIRQDDKTANAGTGETLTLQAQNETGTTSTGGALVLTSGTGTTVAGNTHIQTGGVDKLIVRPTFSEFRDTAEALRITPVSAGTTQITYASTVTAAQINQTTTGSATGAPMTVQAQNAATTGGNLVITSGTGATTAGDVKIQTGAVDRVVVHPTFTEYRDTAEAYRVTPVSAGTTTLQFASTVTAATIFQADLATNAGTGAPLTVQAQNETGTTSVGGALNLTSGTGTTTNGAVNLQVGGTTTASLVTNKFVLNKGFRRNVTQISSGSPYAVLASDDYIAITTLAAPFTINMPATPTLGDTYEFKDATGNAGSNTVTISGNGNNIDGSANFLLNTAYVATTLTFTGSEWSVT